MLLGNSCWRHSQRDFGCFVSFTPDSGPAPTAGNAEEADAKLYDAAVAVLNREGKVKRGGLGLVLGTNKSQTGAVMKRMYEACACPIDCDMKPMITIGKIRIDR